MSLFNFFPYLLTPGDIKYDALFARDTDTVKSGRNLTKVTNEFQILYESMHMLDCISENARFQTPMYFCIDICLPYKTDKSCNEQMKYIRVFFIDNEYTPNILFYCWTMQNVHKYLLNMTQTLHKISFNGPNSMN